VTEAGGRIYFSAASRSLIEEDRIELTSVGVDIGSATSHLLFSRLVLERADTRYIVAERSVLHASDILLTPYRADGLIDAARLGLFIARQYAAAGLTPEQIDTGALILTGVAVRRANARAIGELFSAEAGKFVALSAGDALETLMAAHGSGAAALSLRASPTLCIDGGGGTTKLAWCEGGRPVAMTAVEAGARLIAFDAEGRITRLEPFGARYLTAAGLAKGLGDILAPAERAAVAGLMADAVLAAVRGSDVPGLLRLPPLGPREGVPAVLFSGGVAEFVHGRATADFGDLGADYAAALKGRIEGAGLPVVTAREGIRATVVGASQYTVQVSGSTIYFDPETILPLKNLPVIVPDLDLAADDLDPETVAAAVRAALDRLDLGHGEKPVATALRWDGSASFARLTALARGLMAGLDAVIAQGHPLTIVLDGDVGGLIGVHLRAEEGFAGPVVSIDGIRVAEFDFIDIGEVLRSTGATPVVIKSLVFPGSGGAP
jgi:ethanolamine utilization protein EutA